MTQDDISHDQNKVIDVAHLETFFGERPKRKKKTGDTGSAKAIGRFTH